MAPLILYTLYFSSHHPIRPKLAFTSTALEPLSGNLLSSEELTHQNWDVGWLCPVCSEYRTGITATSKPLKYLPDEPLCT